MIGELRRKLAATLAERDGAMFREYEACDTAREMERQWKAVTATCQKIGDAMEPYLMAHPGVKLTEAVPMVLAELDAARLLVEEAFLEGHWVGERDGECSADRESSEARWLASEVKKKLEARR
jgi:hypothetical protein